MNNETSFVRTAAIYAGILIVASSFLGGILAAGQRTPRRASSASSRSLSAQEVARRVLPSVVLISCDNGESGLQGSGFFVSKGIVITNFHLIKGMERGTARIVLKNAARREFRITHVLVVDEASDLALLGIYDAYNIGIPSLPLDPRVNVNVGETIYAFGNPEGLPGTMSPGIISAGLRKFKERSLLQITAPISSGSSGGPIVNSRGQVIGVAVGTLSGGQNLNFAVPALSVKLLLSRWSKDDASHLDLWLGLVPDQRALQGAWVWLPPGSE